MKKSNTISRNSLEFLSCLCTLSLDRAMSTRSALELKEEGNECFKAGIHITSSNDPRRKQHLANACLKYASALEAIISFECEPVSAEDDGLMDLKANLFFNLAMANYQLNDFNEGRRCCNAAIAFINNPSLLVNDLGDSHDINDDQSLLEPIMQDRQVTAAKVLFRRAKCLYESAKYRLALGDITQASAILPNDKNIAALYRRAQARVQPSKETLSSSDNIHADTTTKDAPPISESESASESDIFGARCKVTSTTSDLCSNGGLCLMRRAYWSQSVTEVCVHIPVKYVKKALQADAVSGGGEDLISNKFEIDFSLKMCALRVKNRGGDGGDVHRVSLVLSHATMPDENIWYKSTIDTVEYIVLMLTKAPPLKEFPGCEWWDRVFEEDEKIDTMTCSIGANTSQLPKHASDRAQQEHERFQALSAAEQQQESDAIKTYKKMFTTAEANTRAQVQAEDCAVQEVPERAEMLEALREEFPSIQFSAK